MDVLARGRVCRSGGVDPATVSDQGIELSFTDERMKKHAISKDDVLNIIEKEDVWMLMLQGGRYNCLMLPASAIDPDVAQRLRQLAAKSH